jgi:hypothetical protein
MNENNFKFSHKKLFPKPNVGIFKKIRGRTLTRGFKKAPRIGLWVQGLLALISLPPIIPS